MRFNNILLYIPLHNLDLNNSVLENKRIAFAKNVLTGYPAMVYNFQFLI